MIVGTGGKAMPMYDTSGQPRGFDIDLANEIAKHLGKTGVTFQSDGSPRRQARKSQVDMALAAISITPKREQEQTFSVPYLTSRFMIAASQRSASRVSSRNLRGLRCAVSKRHTLYKTELSKTGCQQVQARSNKDAMSMVQRGEAEVTIIDETFAPALASKYNLVITDVYTAEDRYGVAMSKGNLTLKRAVDKAIQAMQSDGTMAKLRSRYGLR